MDNAMSWYDNQDNNPADPEQAGWDEMHDE
jgi:hypothetical protein